MKRLVLRNSFFSFVRRRDGPERHGSFQEPAFSVAGELAWVCETVVVWERQRPRLLGTSSFLPSGRQSRLSGIRCGDLSAKC